MKILFNKIPAVLNGIIVYREENCRICNEKNGLQIALVDYWDIKTSKLVKCPNCNHIQLDPMLNDDETAKGCLAYYIEESLRMPESEQKINCLRNFRRGVLFGYSLKIKKIIPGNVLELGPGTGYFSAGLQFVFPDAKISVMDVNMEVLNFNKEQHQFFTIHGIPDNYIDEYKEKFDLVIARDIIEHVTDISKVVSNINRYLKTHGHFHFITPNGHEDVWKHYLTYKMTDSSSELLINHVNYFDGRGLKQLLIQKGFIPKDYYTVQIKSTLKGYGWKYDKKLMNEISARKSADHYINQKQNIPKINFDKYGILDKWYIQNNAKWITLLYSFYQHFHKIRIKPERNIGHEIYGLFIKQHDNI